MGCLHFPNIATKELNKYTDFLWGLADFVWIESPDQWGKEQPAQSVPTPKKIQHAKIIEGSTKAAAKAAAKRE